MAACPHKTQIVVAARQRVVGVGIDVLNAPVAFDAEDKRQVTVGIVDHRAGMDGFGVDRRRIKVGQGWSIGVGSDAPAQSV